MSRRDCLSDAIVKYMNTNLRQIVVPGPLNGVIPPGTTLQDLALKLILEAEREGRLPSFCKDLKAANPNPTFHADLDRCNGLEGVAAGGRPRWYDDPLPMKLPLIDREDLRAALYEMLEQDPKNTHLMIVRGEFAGKSYCRWLIQNVARELGLQVPVFIDLLEIPSVQRLAERLMDEFALPYSGFRERFTTEIREGLQFNEWFAGQSRNFGAHKQWMLIFDHIAKPGVPSDVSSTVLNLAKLAMEVRLTNIWVVLLDCPDTEKLDDPGIYCEATVGPLTKIFVEGFVDWILEGRRQAGDPAPQVPQSICATLNSSFPLQKAQLHNLRREIVGWLKQRPK